MSNAQSAKLLENEEGCKEDAAAKPPLGHEGDVKGRDAAAKPPGYVEGGDVAGSCLRKEMLKGKMGLQSIL